MAGRRGSVLFYHTMSTLMKVLLALLGRWEVVGAKEAVPSGSLIVVSNHLSIIDPPLLAASLPRRLIFMAKQEVFESRLGAPFIRAFGAFPVRRGRVDRLALRHAQSVLDEGHALAMFPEGTRSRDGHMHEGHPGTALVAARSNAPLLPVGIWGSERVNSLPGVFSRPSIVVNIGKPFQLPERKRSAGAAGLADSTDLIMRRVEALLPPAYRRHDEQVQEQVAV